jgi:hypothetical protein
MQAQNRGLTERSGEVFFLDILSHRMSDMAFITSHAIGISECKEAGMNSRQHRDPRSRNVLHCWFHPAQTRNREGPK